jgi:hypothetical protein
MSNEKVPNPARKLIHHCTRKVMQHRTCMFNEKTYPTLHDANTQVMEVRIHSAISDTMRSSGVAHVGKAPTRRCTCPCFCGGGEHVTSEPQMTPAAGARGAGEDVQQQMARMLEMQERLLALHGLGGQAPMHSRSRVLTAAEHSPAASLPQTLTSKSSRDLQSLPPGSLDFHSRPHVAASPSSSWYPMQNQGASPPALPPLAPLPQDTLNSTLKAAVAAHKQAHTTRAFEGSVPSDYADELGQDCDRVLHTGPVESGARTLFKRLSQIGGVESRERENGRAAERRDEGRLATNSVTFQGVEL